MATTMGFMSVLMGVTWTIICDMRVLDGILCLDCWVQKNESHYQGSIMGIA